MKKLSILGVVALLLLGLSATAMSADLKVYGKWMIDATWRENNDFLGGPTGEDKEFDVQQRIDTGFQFIANENLKAVLELRAGTAAWGNNMFSIGAGRSASTSAPNNAGANQAGYGNLMLRKGYLDFNWPGSKVNFKVGYQPVGLPAAFGGGSAIFEDFVAGAVVSTPITDNIKVTAGYARPFESQTFGSATSVSGSGTAADLALLAVPIDFKGFNITPFGAYMNAGKDSRAANSGVTSLAGFYSPNATASAGVRAYWAGVAFTMTALEPFKVMADFNYGSATWNNNAAAGSDGGRSGYLFDIAIDYTGLKFMTPELFFVYTSGEDGNSSKGSGKSERMPIVATPMNWSPGGFFFGDREFQYGFGAQTGYTDRELGFWTVGLALKDISFIDKLSHRINIIYVKGTNDPDFLKQTGTNSPNNTNNYGAFLTDKDSLWEFDLNTKYKIYDQLSVCLNLGYINADFDKDAWGNSSLAQRNLYRAYGSKDAYRAALGLTYAF